jgi:hypothetical protein
VPPAAGARRRCVPLNAVPAPPAYPARMLRAQRPCGAPKPPCGRYADFQVSEIGADGAVARLTSLSFDPAAAAGATATAAAAAAAAVASGHAAAPGPAAGAAAAPRGPLTPEGIAAAAAAFAGVAGEANGARLQALLQALHAREQAQQGQRQRPTGAGPVEEAACGQPLNGRPAGGAAAADARERPAPLSATLLPIESKGARTVSHRAGQCEQVRPEVSWWAARCGPGHTMPYHTKITSPAGINELPQLTSWVPCRPKPPARSPRPKTHPPPRHAPPRPAPTQAAHAFIRTDPRLPPLDSDAVDDPSNPGQRLIYITPRADPAAAATGGGRSWGGRGGGAPGSRKRGRGGGWDGWPGGGDKFVKFVLYKENIETQVGGGGGGSSTGD